jgi:hypothetical protein
MKSKLCIKEGEWMDVKLVNFPIQYGGHNIYNHAIRTFPMFLTHEW